MVHCVLNKIFKLLRHLQNGYQITFVYSAKLDAHAQSSFYAIIYPLNINYHAQQVCLFSRLKIVTVDQTIEVFKERSNNLIDETSLDHIS